MEQVEVKVEVRPGHPAREKLQLRHFVSDDPGCGVEH